MPKKINLKLYDIDGCLFHAYLNNAPIQEWLISTNKIFFDDQLAEIKAKKFDKVIVGYGTNRQDRDTDNFNSNRGGSCAAAIPIVQHYFSRKLECEVELDPFWRADLDSSSIAGDSLKAVLKELHSPCKATDVKHSRYLFDLHKVSLIYAHAQRVKDLNPDADEIVIDFYDDHPTILQTIHDFFNLYPDLLPKNVVLRTHHYKIDGKSTSEQYKTDIKGSGEPDPLYKWSVSYMSTLTNMLTEQDMPTDLDIQSAAQLKEHHEAHANHSRRSIMYVNNVTFDADKFKAFRSKEIPKLDLENKCGQEKNYTTATQLIRDGLLSPEVIAENRLETTVVTSDILDDADEPMDDDCPLEITEEMRRELLNEAKRLSGSLHEHLNGLYLRNEIDISLYLEILNLDSQEYKNLACPEDFNATNFAQQILKKNRWDGQCGELFWTKMQKKNDAFFKESDLISLAKTVRKKIMGIQKDLYFENKKTETNTSLTEFEKILSALSENKIAKEVTFSAIKIFCKKWKIQENINITTNDTTLSLTMQI